MTAFLAKLLDMLIGVLTLRMFRKDPPEDFLTYPTVNKMVMVMGWIRDRLDELHWTYWRSVGGGNAELIKIYDVVYETSDDLEDIIAAIQSGDYAAAERYARIAGARVNQHVVTLREML